MTKASDAPAPRWQVFVPGPNDFVRTPAGAVRLFASVEEAQAAAAEHGGFVQPAGAAPPAGFDRTFF